jgi:mono/diheme cytochrome c family protein
VSLRRLVLASLLVACDDDAAPSGTSESGEIEGTTAVETSTTGAVSDSSTTDVSSSSDASAEDPTPIPDIPQPISFAEIQPIFATHCVPGCHEPTGGYPALDLGSSARTNLVFVASNGSPLLYVSSGDHEASYLWHKLSGTQGTVGGLGARMPAGAPALEQEDIDLVAAWIDAGAPP